MHRTRRQICTIVYFSPVDQTFETIALIKFKIDFYWKLFYKYTISLIENPRNFLNNQRNKSH